jgi:predicted acylesterase/phospholipase RssA
MPRAITLAGGGPAAGLHIGALEALEEAGITFDVWALSCIGAWVGIVYNQWEDGNKAQKTYNFFRDHVFRDNESYSRFPINTVFGPDLRANTVAFATFLSDPRSYEHLLLPGKVIEAFRESIAFWSKPANWGSEGDINHWMLDQVLAVHPFSRFLTSLLYLAPVTGLSRIYYPDSSFLKAINFKNLFKLRKVFIYHNAWNMDKKEMQLFSNITNDGYKDISPQSLCACSALPYIEQPVTIDNDVYCEGALIETINFSHLIEQHKPDEIWISRIVDPKQVKTPRNITDALGNLCMLFAGALGDDDVKLFKYHAKDEGWQGIIYEIRVSADINFDWSHKNLENGRTRGRAAVTELLYFYYFLQRYLSHNIKDAAVYADKLHGDHPLGLIAKAVAAHRTGAKDKAREAIKSLCAMDRAWSRYPRLELERTIHTRTTLNSLMNDLQAAGLQCATASVMEECSSTAPRSSPSDGTLGFHQKASD